MINRIIGLDLARFLAFVGMIIVNFRVAMGADIGDLAEMLKLIDGKAAATFVTLAGVGLSLSLIKTTRVTVIKRAVFLFAFGLLNTLVFNADILHYYGVYLLIGAFFLRKSSKALFLSTLCSIVIFNIFIITFNYSVGWDWTTLAYNDFWTFIGFIRNLFFNGFHPVFPWISFLFFGMWLGRQNLASYEFQKKMFVIGSVIVLIVEFLSRGIQSYFVQYQPELDFEIVMALVGTSPMPPNVFYVTGSLGFAAAIISICLVIGQKFHSSKLLYPFVKTGQLSLSLYILHIYLGLGILESNGYLENQSVGFAFICAILFSIFAIAFSIIWLKFFKRGPVENLMRRITG